MIKVLLVHDTQLTNDDYLKKFYLKYPYLKGNSRWKVIATKLQYVGAKWHKNKNIDKIYYDQATIDPIKVTDIIGTFSKSQIFPISFDKPKRLKKDITLKIVKFEEY